MKLASTIEVPGEGNPKSRIWLVGEAPGEQEVKEQRPFVGQAGKVLDGLLQEAGISRTECYIDNLVRFRPHANKFEEFYGTEIYTNGVRQITDTISKARPHIVVALGNEPLRALGGDLSGGIGTWRGSIIQCCGESKLIGTFHPSYLLRAWSDRPLAVHDLTRARAESWFPEIRRKRRTIALNQPFNKLIKILEDMNENSTFVAFDIETESNVYISSIAFADSPEFAVVVPIRFRGRSHWSEVEERQLRVQIKRILENRNINKIAQNAQYDCIWLKDKWGVAVAPLYMDTMAAHALNMPEYDKSLAFQCSIYTDIPYYKFQGKSDDPDTYFRYNGTDALATFECAQEIQEQLEEDGLWDFYQRLPHRLLAPLRELSLRGIKVNLALREEMQKEGEEEKRRLIETIRSETSIRTFEDEHLRKGAEAKIRQKWEESKQKLEKSGKTTKSAISIKYPTPEDYIHARAKDLPTFNPDSPLQLAEYLYRFRGWKTIYDDRRGGERTPTANASALRKLLSQHQEPLLQSFLDLADITKELEFLSARLEPDGRLHCTYDITGTETGRISSKKYVYDSGANLQNQPAGKRKESSLRRIFIPDEGKVFIQRDLKQAEAWMVAFLSRDPFLMDAIRSSDIHRRTASLIFRKPEGEISKRERDLAKRCVHALNYGMGYIKFAEQVGISAVEARDLRNRYFAAFPRIQLWHNEIKMHLAKNREIVTPLGRKRQFAAGWSEDLWKEAWAYVPQSTIGDLLNIGFLEFWEWLKEPVNGLKDHPFTNERAFDCQIMLQIHDSLIVQCPPEHVPVIAAKLKSCLERPLKVNGETIVIPTDCSVGENWLDLKEWKED